MSVGLYIPFGHKLSETRAALQTASARVRRNSNPARGADEERRDRKRLTMTQPKLFDVILYPPRQRVVRVRAKDEREAGEVATDFFEICTSVKSPDKRRRTVYAWRLHKGVVPVARRNRRAQ